MTERRTPRQNRVTPTGDIVVCEARGRAMGNRGNLLDERGQLVRDWALTRWICCTLDEVHGRKVKFENTRGYTPLFFTDEAVALAAGHRPCGSCRPEAYYRWLAIWKDLAGVPRSERVRAGVMDRDLHRRRRAMGMQRRRPVRLSEVSEGAFVSIDRIAPSPLLIWQGRAWSWSRGNYVFEFTLGDATSDIQCFPFWGTSFLAAGFYFDDELRPVPDDHARKPQPTSETGPG